jgi:predicted amidohydrolase
MEDLKLAFFQMNIIWEEPKSNLDKVLKKVQEIDSDTDILILPEMCTTGFSMHPEKIAEPWDNSSSVQTLQNIADDSGIAIMGSLAISDGDAFFNRFVFIQPYKTIEYYDKRHLFTLAGEDKVYSPGEKTVVWNYRNWRIKVQICYDLRFPVWSRNTEDYDLLVYVANWPKKRIEAWNTLLKARAIENMSYAIGVNRFGEDGNGYEYNGMSACYDALGAQLASISEVEDSIQVVLNKTKLNEKRNRLGFLKDQDDFEFI